MVAQVLPFFPRPEPQARDWTQQELAEFYRVESALLQAGVQLESDRGLSDEGDPWFIFCRGDTGDVFIHFARIDGVYVVDGAAFEAPVRGPDFGALVRQLIGRYPLAKIREARSSNVFVHPAALLIALVGAAFFNAGDARAAEAGEPREGGRRASLILASNASAAPPGPAAPTPQFAEGHAAAVILSAVLTLNGDLFSLVSEEVQTAAVSVVDNWAQPTATEISSAHSDGSVQALAEAAQFAPPTPIAGQIPLVASAPVERATMITPLSDANAAEEAMIFLPVASAAGLPASSAPITPPSPTTPKPLFIGKAVTPQSGLDAVEWLTGADGDSVALLDLKDKELVLVVDRLPANLLDLIRRGEHIDFSQLIPIGRLEPVSTPEPFTPPIVETLEPNLGPTPVLSGARSAREARIDAAIAAFVAQADNLEIIMEGDRLVLFDEDIFSPFAGDLNLSSVTFTFDDGSSISLVGTTEDLAGFFWAV